MTLPELLKAANEGYSDGYLANYFDEETGQRKEGTGDTLALFIVLELSETFESDAEQNTQLDEAIRVMEAAAHELHEVINALDRARP